TRHAGGACWRRNTLGSAPRPKKSWVALLGSSAPLRAQPARPPPARDRALREHRADHHRPGPDATRGTGDGFRVLGRELPAAALADDDRPRCLPAVPVDEEGGRLAVRGRPAIAPAHERRDRGEEIPSLRGEDVLEARWVVAVPPPLDDAVLRQRREPVGEHVRRDAEVAAEVLEARDAREQVAE